MCVYALPEVILAASKIVFMRWLDSVIKGLIKHNCLICYGGIRQHGFFTIIILMSEFLTITSVFLKHLCSGAEIVLPMDFHVVSVNMLGYRDIGAQCLHT